MPDYSIAAFPLMQLWHAEAKLIASEKKHIDSTLSQCNRKEPSNDASTIAALKLSNATMTKSLQEQRRKLEAAQTKVLDLTSKLQETQEQVRTGFTFCCSEEICCRAAMTRKRQACVVVCPQQAQQSDSKTARQQALGYACVRVQYHQETTTQASLQEELTTVRREVRSLRDAQNRGGTIRGSGHQQPLAGSQRTARSRSVSPSPSRQSPPSRPRKDTVENMPQASVYKPGTADMVDTGTLTRVHGTEAMDTATLTNVHGTGETDARDLGLTSALSWAVHACIPALML